MTGAAVACMEALMTLSRLVAGLLVVALSACGPRQLVVTMNSDNNSGQTGFATITEGAGQFEVVVETSVPEFISSSGQLAHIHEGNCGEIGKIRANLANLTRLPDEAGKTGRFGSTTQILATTLKFEEFKTGEWAINAHDERDNLVYVSCGQVPKQ